MIGHLRIKNVALIDEVETEFTDGFNVLTGETGAGKSIVVDSINFLLGERPARDFIRSGADSAAVEGIFDINDADVRASLADAGFEAEENQIMIQRALNAQGKSTCKINGRSVTVGLLKEISAQLVDVHGQHEHQSLLNINKQMQLLDQFCGNGFADAKKKLDGLLQRFRENGRRLKMISDKGGNRRAQLDILEYQRDEIQKAKLKQGEEEALTAKKARLGGLEKLHRCTSEALALLSGSENNENSASDAIGRAVFLLREIGRLDSEKISFANALSEAEILISDTVRDLNGYAEELEADPGELERIEARLDVIYKLKKKYGPTSNDVFASLDKIMKQIDRMTGSDEEIKKLNADRKSLISEITSVCDMISEERKERAASIGKRIEETLRELGMENARFEIALTRKPTFGPDGNDKIEFMISPNPGEGLKPLNRIASGGEMSRVMLAVKTVLAAADKIETLIFDEIDSGVSGRTAQQVAEKLMLVSRNKQILCITHLPQIAAMADSHFVIEKRFQNEKTLTTVRLMDRAEIIITLARLTGGAEITGATLAAAEDMKSIADSIKSKP